MELPEAQVVDNARKITGLREHLRLTAATVASQPDQLKFYEEKELKNLAAQVSRNHYPLTGSKKRSRLDALRTGQLELPEEVPLGLKRRGRKPKTIGLNQKLDIVHRVLVGGESQSDLAKDYRVSQSLISNLITKV